MFGQIELERECFQYKELDENVSYKNLYLSLGETDSSLYTVNSGYKRPCEWNRFTKWLVEKNSEKIRKLFGFTDN